MPKIVDHDERRAAIAIAAADVIATEGVERTTLKQIACRAGVTTGAVTHYFSDKDEVIVAALLQADAAMQHRLDAAANLGGAPVDRLLNALPHDAESRRDWVVSRAFADAAIRSEALRLHHRRSKAQWLETASESVARQAGCTIAEARLDAELIVAVVDAIGDAACVDPDDWPVARQRQILEHCLSRTIIGHSQQH